MNLFEESRADIVGRRMLREGRAVRRRTGIALMLVLMLGVGLFVVPPAGASPGPVQAYGGIVGDGAPDTGMCSAEGGYQLSGNYGDGRHTILRGWFTDPETLEQNLEAFFCIRFQESCEQSWVGEGEGAAIWNNHAGAQKKYIFDSVRLSSVDGRWPVRLSGRYQGYDHIGGSWTANGERGSMVTIMRADAYSGVCYVNGGTYAGLLMYAEGVSEPAVGHCGDSANRVHREHGAVAGYSYSVDVHRTPTAVEVCGHASRPQVLNESARIPLEPGL